MHEQSRSQCTVMIHHSHQSLPLVEITPPSFASKSRLTYFARRSRVNHNAQPTISHVHLVIFTFQNTQRQFKLYFRLHLRRSYMLSSVVYSSSGKIKATNRDWITTGDIDELEYTLEIDRGERRGQAEDVPIIDLTLSDDDVSTGPKSTHSILTARLHTRTKQVYGHQVRRRFFGNHR